MNHGGGEAVAAQGFGDAVGGALGACEDQASAGFFGQEAHQEAMLLINGDLEGLHADVIGWFERRVERETNWVAKVVLYQVDDRRFQGGGEEQGLALFREDRDDAANGWKEAHVQHAVGFVEDQDLEGVEVEEASVQVIFEAAGGGYYHARAFADGLELGAFGEAANYQGGGAELLAAQDIILIDDLHGEFASGDEDEGSDAFGLGRSFQQLLHDWDQEGEGLAGAGLGGGENVFAFKSLGDSCGLHRGGRDELCGRQALLGVSGNR